jgi:hypothetical protein
MEAVHRYFDLGMKYKDIVNVLYSRHCVSISERHLKRILKVQGCCRRTNYSDIDDVFAFIDNETHGSGHLHGYRWMHAKCTTKVTKETVRVIAKLLDPAGVECRRKRRLER